MRHKFPLLFILAEHILLVMLGPVQVMPIDRLGPLVDFLLHLGRLANVNMRKVVIVILIALSGICPLLYHNKT